MDLPSSQNYSVAWRAYAERHYAKVFSKNYQRAWLTTRVDINDVCARIDAVLRYKRADLISSVGQYKLVKLDFSLAGSRISPKSSGNRCVLFIDEDSHHVDVLLAYSKNDIGSPGETAKWKAVVKQQYPDVAGIFSL